MTLPHRGSNRLHPIEPLSTEDLGVLSSSVFPYTPDLTSIYCRACSLGDAGLVALLPALAKLTQLTVLQLDRMCVEFCHYLENNSTLPIKDNDLTDEGVIALVPVLMSLPRLCNLNIAGSLSLS